ncbi:unnamed protein product [Spirodela intermedia]|uniref:Uncharacterized protein n=1 Tax=Spirodela intermedia TaxID=51605 RepID=A0A7I8J1R0_SPIIN|nr:unnamed protein product [Spirodela intermedia]CAA6664154.1 unnamed protein product [Spirodela intermedia]
MATRAAVTKCSRAAPATAAGRRSFVTSTAVKTKAYSFPIPDFIHEPHGRRVVVKGEYVPVCVSLGLIGLSASLGLVLVSKKRREMVPEVEDPDWAIAEAELFLSHSIFRRLAHLQDYRHPASAVSYPFRPAIPSSTQAGRVEDLKTVGVGPRAH